MSFDPRKSVSKVGFAVGAAVLVLGCGGGGGGGTGGSGGGTSGIAYPITNLSLIAVYAGTKSPVNLSEAAAGNNIQFEIQGTDADNNPIVVMADSYSTTAPSSVASLSGGLLKVNGSSSGTTYKVTASYLSPKSPGGTAASTFSATYVALAKEDSVSGTAHDTNGAVLGNLTVNFFDSSQKVVATTQTGTDGTFRANVPSSAKTFSPDFSAWTANYNLIYYYGSNTYSISVNTSTNKCLPPLPTLSSTSNVPLPNAIVAIPVDINNPPPAPTCGLGG